MQFLGYNETKKLSIVQFIMRNYRKISTVVCAGQHDVRKQLRGNFHLCQMKLLVLAAPEATGRCNCCICGGGGASTYLTWQKTFWFHPKRKNLVKPESVLLSWSLGETSSYPWSPFLNQSVAFIYSISLLKRSIAQSLNALLACQ